MRILAIILGVCLVLLQYRLWVSDQGMREIWRLNQSVEAQTAANAEQHERNSQLLAEVTDLKIGFCIDTCHCLASGYDVSSAAGLKLTVAEMDRLLGLDNVRVIHANDSKTPLGSHVDRHEHIGHGYIGKEGFRRILNHPKLCAKAFILETPFDAEGDELRNMEMLKKLCRKSSMTTTRSN